MSPSRTFRLQQGLAVWVHCHNRRLLHRVSAALRGVHLEDRIAGGRRHGECRNVGRIANRR